MWVWSLSCVKVRRCWAKKRVSKETEVLQHHKLLGHCKRKQQCDITTRQLERPKSKTLGTPHWEEVERGNSHPLLLEIRRIAATWEGSLAVTHHAKHRLTSSCTLRHSPDLFENYIHPKTCPQMFMAAFFIIAKMWKQPRCSNRYIDKWMGKRTVECYSATKGNEPSSRKERFWNFKCMLLRQRSQSEKAPYHVIPFTWHPGSSKQWRQ